MPGVITVDDFRKDSRVSEIASQLQASIANARQNLSDMPIRDRERWFSVLMGEKYSLDENATEKLSERIAFPEVSARTLQFDLSVFYR